MTVRASTNRHRSFFQYAGSVSRLWLPPLLNNLADIPPTLCGADGCSIFLVWNKRLHLAATTRPEAKARLFDLSVSYAVDKTKLGQAAKDADNRTPNEDGSLTGWVAAFDRPLNLKDQRSLKELKRFACRQECIPRPVWSNRGGGYPRWQRDSPSPFLAVPMHHNSRVHGVVRVVSLRERPRPFTALHQRRLEEFSQYLSDFLVEQELLDQGLEHYFRIWAAQDDSIVDRITAAVPALFDVDCCSFFQRDSEDRFVLRNAAASQRLRADKVNADHFEKFREDAIGNLYYQAGRSKTGTCIETQMPLLLRRVRASRSVKQGKWMTVIGKERRTLKSESGGRVLAATRAASLARCEIHPDRSRSLLVVPVLDVINPRMLAGVLRVVSTAETDLTERNLIELDHFADSLAQRLGDTTRQEIQRESSRRLIEELANLGAGAKKNPDAGYERWSVAARVVAQALDADAATVFLRRDGKLRTEPNWSFLNLEQIRRSQSNADEIQEQYEHFRTRAVPQMQRGYDVGQGCTGWPAQHRRVLNLKDLDDAQELKRWKIEPGPFRPKPGKRVPHIFCEILEPGPFIAAPIMLPGSEIVEGVVRALRSHDNQQGPFTAAHEHVLGTCTTILASFSRSLQKPRVLVSYSNHKLKDSVEGIIRAMRIEPLSVAGRLTSPHPGDEFDRLLPQANAAFVIVTKDERVNNRRGAGHHWQPSINVVHEIGELKVALPTRTIILCQQGVRLPDVASELPHYEFRGPDDLDKLYPTIIGALQKWDLVADVVSGDV